MSAKSNPSTQSESPFLWEQEVMFSADHFIDSADLMKLFDPELTPDSTSSSDEDATRSTASVTGSTTAKHSSKSAASDGKADSGSKKDAKSAKRTGVRRPRRKLTPDERLKISRDRNREHARRTRLKKKAYIEDLRRKLELFEKSSKSGITSETEILRRQAVEMFLTVRCSSEADPAQWAEVVESNIVVTSPVSTFGQVPGKGSKSCGPGRISVEGIQGLIDDTQLFCGLAGQLTVSCGYEVDVEFRIDEVLSSTSGVACKWSLLAKTMYNNGSTFILTTGMLFTSFKDDSTKIRSVDFQFDVFCLMTQIKAFISNAQQMFSLGIASPNSVFAAGLPLLCLP